MIQQLSVICYRSQATEQTTKRQSSRAVVNTTIIQANNNDPVVKSIIFYRSQATEETTERRSSRAVVKTTVIQANNNDPVVTVPFTGYINENSPIGSAPTNSDGSSLLRVTVTDGDLVCVNKHSLNEGRIQSNLNLLLGDNTLIC